MENSGHNYMNAIWFNVKLFTINGAPLKFDLVGYSPTEFHDTVKIIEAYGGKLSMPDDPSTLIFCESNRPVGAEEYDRYDIKYFHDSIAALQPQQLMKYKLQGFTNQRMTSSAAGVKSTHFHNEIPESLTTDQRSTSPKDDDKLTDSHRRQKYNSGPKGMNELSERENPCTSTRVYSHPTKSASDVDRLNGNKIEGSSTNCHTNDRNNDNHDGVYGKSRRNPEKDTSHCGDPRVFQRAYERDPEFIPSSRLRRSLPAKRGEKKKQERGDGIKRCYSPTFTEEENQIIIKWLIKKDVIPTNSGIQIWVEFLQEKVLPDRNVTPGNLMGYFYRSLKNHPLFVKHMQNVISSGRVRQSVYKSHRYTDEESRVIIQYLIANDFIHRTESSHVWSACLKECQSSLNPTRTPRGLKTYFRERLYKKHAKYTEDPEALRKFKEIELKFKESK